jgi:phage minor structural protein
MKIWVLNKDEQIQAVLQNRGTAVILDAIEKEGINKEHIFEFVIPADHEKAQFVVEENIVLIQDPDGNWQEFVIREIEDKHTDRLERRAICEHAYTELLDTIIRDKRPTSDATGMLTQILQDTRWSVGDVTVPASTTTHIFYNKSALECIHEIVDLFGGELQFRTEFTGNKITARYVDLLAQRGAERGKRYVHGKDVTGVTRIVDTTNLVTALIGRGKGVENEEGTGYGRKLDFSDVVWSVANGDPIDKPAGQDWVGDPAVLQQFGRPDGQGGLKHRERVIEFDDETDSAKLLERTWEAYQQMSKPIIGYELDVIDLESAEGYAHEAVRLGDTVAVIDRKFEPEIRIKARVLEIERDHLVPQNTKVVIGNAYEPFKSVERQFELEDRVKDETVPTTWLDGIINALQNQILAGGGTVIVSNDGQLILDKPADQNPTKAIFLGNGILTISNERTAGDPATVGGWNFRTFVTGDGVVADEINAGTMRANRIKGGNLALGGEVGPDSLPVHGHLWIYDADNKLAMDFDGAYGGVHKLRVGELIADNVTESTTPTQEKQTNYIYVRNGWYQSATVVITGDDVTGDGSQNNPYRTLSRAFQDIPRDNGADWVIHAGGIFYEHLVLRGFRGDGSIKVYMDNHYQGSTAPARFYGWVRISSCRQKFEFYDGDWIHDGTGHPRNDDDDGQAVFHIIRSDTVWLEGLTLVSISKSKYMVSVSQNSFAYLKDCGIFSHSDPSDPSPVALEAGVFCFRGSKVVLYDCYGVTGTDISKPGLLIQTASIGAITGDNSSQPYAINGSQLLTAVTATQTGIYKGPDSFSSKSVGTVSVLYLDSKFEIRPQYAETWRQGEGGNADDGGGGQGTWECLQGAAYYPHLLDPDLNITEADAYGGMNIGFIWFKQSDLDALKNKEFSEIRVRVKRKAQFGQNKPVQIKMWLHSLAYPTTPNPQTGWIGLDYYNTTEPLWNPLTDPSVNLREPLLVEDLVWGDDVWVKLPSEYEDAFESGTVKGIAFYHEDYKQSAAIDPDYIEIQAYYNRT